MSAALTPHHMLCAILAVLPWLLPFTWGPSPATVSWLFTAACAIVLWAVCAPRAGGAPRTWPAWTGLLVAATAWLYPGFRQELVFFTAGLILIGLGAGVVRDRVAGEWILEGLLAAACVNAVFGLLQYFGVSASFAPWVNFGQAGEAYGNLRQPNHFSSLCWLGFAIAVWAPRLPAWLRWSAVVLLAAASAASVSRTGVLQGMVLTALAASWGGPERVRRLSLCALGAAAYFVASATFPLLLEGWAGALPARTLWGRLGMGDACSSRVVLWSNVLLLIADKPWVGWGWGELDYAHFMTLYPGARFCDILDNAHNLPLHLAAELGVPAAALVTGGFAWWVLRQRPWGELDDRRRLAWALLAVILIHSLLEYPLWYGPFQVVLGVCLGWLHAPSPDKSDQPRQGLANTLPLPALAATAALLAGVAYAAWDYARVSQIYLPPDQRREPWLLDPLEAARRSWLFANQARFAELMLTPLTRANASWMEATADDMLHYSPEPRVIERLVESATLNGHEEKALAILARYSAAFPHDFEQWRARQRPPLKKQK